MLGHSVPEFIREPNESHLYRMNHFIQYSSGLLRRPSEYAWLSSTLLQIPHQLSSNKLFPSVVEGLRPFDQTFPVAEPPLKLVVGGLQPPDQTFFNQHVLLGISFMYEKFRPCEINHKKYDYFTYVYFNIFTNHFQEKHLELFSQIQKIHHGFVKLARLFKYRKAHIHNTCDLVTNSFPSILLSFPANLKVSKVWSVLQNGSLFFFNRRDLIQILNTALGNAPNFFAEPLHCKNPYNNVIFTVADLYNMYFFICGGDMKISFLIHEFYACDFQLTSFNQKNEYLIREHAIKNFVKNGTFKDLYEGVLDMLEHYIPKKIPHEDFPMDNLVNVMRPFLELYLSMQWLPHHRKNYSKILNRKLWDFYRKNPTYGRKIITKARTMFGEIIEGADPIVHFVTI